MPEEESFVAPSIIDIAAPFATAKLFLNSCFTAAGEPTLYHHRDSFHMWSGTAYREFSETSLRARLYEFLDRCIALDAKGKPRPVKPNTAMVGNVVDGLRAAAHLLPSISAPAWLDHVPDVAAEDIIACANGLLHLPTLTLLRHSPRFFNYNVIDVTFDPHAEAPVQWLHFLNELWPNDRQTTDTLQEIFGYCLTGDTRQQKAFLLVGPKRSGKGTLARVLARVVGLDSTVAPTLAGLGTNFGLAPLIGKHVAIISDARLGSRADQHAIVERILSISGEDAITVDRKFLPAWTGRLLTRFIILSNELPRLADASGALASRFIVLVLTNSFYGREDQGLTDRLFGEMRGILNWSIAGLQRLRGRGYFIQPDSAAEAVQDLEDLGSPIGAFLRDCCVVAPGQMVEIERLFEVWTEWRKAHGSDHAGTTQTFGRDLRAAVPGLKRVQPRDETCGRLSLYEGVGRR